MIENIEKSYNSHCNGCGACCLAISVNSTHDIIIDRILNDYSGQAEKALQGHVHNFMEVVHDQLFMFLYWEPITREEAIKLNPVLEKYPEDKGYYICTAYDSVSNKCLMHDNKPFVCSAYPFYRNEKLDDEFVFLSEECGFIKGGN